MEHSPAGCFVFWLCRRQNSNALELTEHGKCATLKAGKQADLVVINGDPSQEMADIEKELVFKDGIAYDSRRLIDSVQEAAVGLHL